MIGPLVELFERFENECGTPLDTSRIQMHYQTIRLDNLNNVRSLIIEGKKIVVNVYQARVWNRSLSQYSIENHITHSVVFGH